ncbi:MAG: BMP family ABC transporter substrate-binding protein, partial [Lachnospiraceae bacterium]|nr:BMP family ABC transporter substrate-binding protein [Lachnospiraceae bacterium]
MKKKLLAVLMTAAMVLSLVACGAKEEPKADAPEAATEEAAPAETFKVGLITDVGGVEDQSFNQSAWEGLQKAKEDFGVEINYLSSATDADYAP